jgi:hypothetical protein
MVFKKRTALAVATLVAPLLLADTSLAKSAGKSGNSKIRVEADLEPDEALAILEPDAEGDARFDQQNKKGAEKTRRFQAKVKIPVDPASPLGLIDATTAQSADVQLNLSKGTIGATPYATCFLDFKEVEQEFEDGVAKLVAVFKVDVRLEYRGKKPPRERRIHGFCDTDLVTADVQNGTPIVADGDFAEALLVVPPAIPGGMSTNQSIVSGLFSTKF